jgi:hypothetical protein
MILKIELEDREPLAKLCATFQYPCKFFTMENNPNLVQAEILWAPGEDLPSKYAFILGQMLQTYRHERIYSNALNKLK